MGVVWLRGSGFVMEGRGLKRKGVASPKGRGWSEVAQFFPRGLTLLSLAWSQPHPAVITEEALTVARHSPHTQQLLESLLYLQTLGPGSQGTLDADMMQWGCSQRCSLALGHVRLPL